MAWESLACPLRPPLLAPQVPWLSSDSVRRLEVGKRNHHILKSGKNHHGTRVRTGFDGI